MAAPFSAQSANLSASFQGDAVVRATGILGLGAVAAIHFAQVVPTSEQTPWLGAAFVALILGCVGLAGLLLHRGGRLLWAAVATLSVLAIAGYVFTRLVSTPLDNADVGNWSESLGVAAVFIEGILFLLSLHAITGRPTPKAAVPTATAVSTSSLVRSPAS